LCACLAIEKDGELAEEDHMSDPIGGTPVSEPVVSVLDSHQQSALVLGGMAFMIASIICFSL
jgi:hypothetical protein